MAEHFEDYCEDKARKGDGAFAIAYAILQLADEQKKTAAALSDLGLAGAASPHGAVELLSLNLLHGSEGISEGLRAVATAIEERS